MGRHLPGAHSGGLCDRLFSRARNCREYAFGCAAHGGGREHRTQSGIDRDLQICAWFRIAGRHSGAATLSLSFYAFQGELTYTIDIYRGDSKPAPSYLSYAASVSFFPTTLAGPITRVSSLIPQWTWKDVVLTGEEGSRGLFLISLGLAKKFLIADYLGNNLVNRVFDLPTFVVGRRCSGGCLRLRISTVLRFFGL